MSIDPVPLEQPGERATRLRVPRVPRIPAWVARNLRWLLPLVVLTAAMLVVSLLFVTKPTPHKSVTIVPPPPVRVMSVAPRSIELTVATQGSVTPRTESDLVAEVAGRVMWVSPRLVAGGFFAKGEALLRFDGRDHTIAAQRAEATVQRRQSEARLAAADADRRRALSERGAASDAELEQMESRLQVAQAALLEARASLAQARLDLERTQVRAPYDGRVRERQVDLGQFVSPGAVLGRIHATDYAEVRLPVPTGDLAHLDVKLGFGSSTEQAEPRAVTLRAQFAGREYSWPAVLTRTEGEIDERTRMLHVVARVDDPYRRAEGATGPPLAAGLFVDAEIQGRALSDVFVLPGSALRDDDRVLIVDAEDRLRFREVEVIRRSRNEVVIGSGLRAGDRVVTSPLSAVTDGMQVRPLDPSTS